MKFLQSRDEQIIRVISKNHNNNNNEIIIIIIIPHKLIIIIIIFIETRSHNKIVKIIKYRWLG